MGKIRRYAGLPLASEVISGCWSRYGFAKQSPLESGYLRHLTTPWTICIVSIGFVEVRCNDYNKIIEDVAV